ncbi:MAG: hypothetical protein ACTHLC_00210 [Rhizobiaceae bacterium]
MTGTDKKTDDKKFNETLKRMLETPPKPHVKDSETSNHSKKKPGDTPAKKRRPEDQ